MEDLVDEIADSVKEDLHTLILILKQNEPASSVLILQTLKNGMQELIESGKKLVEARPKKINPEHTEPPH